MIIRFLSRKLSRKEEQELLQRDSINSVMQQQWDEPDNDISKFDRQEIWKQIEAKTLKQGKTGIGRSDIRQLIVWTAAACFILLIGLGYYGYRNIFGNREPQWIYVETGFQERKEITLPDSSKVWLNAGSRIEYPEIFTDTIRAIKLIGEAFFDVTSHKKQAFVVSTDNLQIRVLGTRFSISDYRDGESAEAVLLSGKVRVNAETGLEIKQIDLSPDEQLLFCKESQTMSVQNIDALLHTGWTKGRLSFDDTELDIVISRLERWYGIKINYPEKLGKSYRLTFTVRNESFEQIVQLIQNSIPIRFNQSENNIYTIEYEKVKK